MYYLTTLNTQWRFGKLIMNWHYFGHLLELQNVLASTPTVLIGWNTHHLRTREHWKPVNHYYVQSWNIGFFVAEGVQNRCRNSFVFEKILIKVAKESPGSVSAIFSPMVGHCNLGGSLEIACRRTPDWDWF